MAPGAETLTKFFVLMKKILSVLLFFWATTVVAEESVRAPMTIDPLWKSEEFRRAFTASYGIDARIEPTVNTEEKAVLESVSTEMASGDREGAIAKLTSRADLNDSAALIFALGNLRFEEGKTGDAVANFERAVELYPNFRDAHRNLAVALVQQSQFEKAEPHLIRAMELGARDGLTLGLLGYVHASADRYQASLQAYRLAQLTMPDEPQWKLGEAHALLALDDPRASASLYTELIARRRADGVLWMNQADAYLQLGEPERGIANLEFVRRLGKLGPAETASLGHLYLNEDLVVSAMDCYREAITAEPPVPLAKAVDAVENLTRFRHWTEARELSEALAAAPAYAQALTSPESVEEGDKDLVGAEIRSRLTRSRALIELEVGDAEIGAGMVRQLIDADPLDAPALILMAKFESHRERVEEAEMLLEQAARVPEYEPEALRALGEMRVRMGRYGEALEPLRRSLALEPDESLAAYLDAVERAVPK